MNNTNFIFILLLTLPFYLCSLAKRDIKASQIKNLTISQEKKLYKGLEKKALKFTVNKFNLISETSKQHPKEEITLVSENQSKVIENLKNKFYLNFSLGYTSLKNYDVYNTSTNKAIWDDRYTKLGKSFELGFGYDFGKIRTELSYAQENGRFDEYITYVNNSMTKINSDRGHLHKDFYFLNTYYDFRDNKRLSPYIGLGLGFVNSVQESAPFIPEYVRQSFVLQFKGGLSYKFSKTNILFIEGFKRNANSHTTNDGLGTAIIYEAKDGFDSSGIQIGFRKII